MSKTHKIIEALMREVTSSPEEHPVPAGWFSVLQICKELQLAHTRNASSRAYDLCRRGMLERQQHIYKTNSGHCHKAYIYKPLPPYKSIKQASEQLFQHCADKVPKEWVRLVDYADSINVSDVALRQRASRARLKPKFFKTPRGVIGLHRNAHYLKAELKALYRNG